MSKFNFQKPRIKPCYYVIPQNYNQIQIGVTYGHAYTIEDSDGKTKAILNLMNGERTINQIGEIVRKNFKDVTDHKIESLILKLSSVDLIEDASNIPLNELSRSELRRYKNQLSFFSMFTTGIQSKYEFQQKLKSSTITLIGLGGGGSNILISLASIGVGKIIGIDFDKVEMKNLNRQILYTERDCGKLKTEVAARRIIEINPHIKFEAINLRVDTLAKARKIARNTDFVICTADGPVYTLYEIVNRACVEKGIPWISFGTVEATGIVGPLIIPGRTACYHCIIGDRKGRNPDYLKNIDYIRSKEKFFDINLIYPSIIPMFSYCGSLIVLETMKHITGFAKSKLYGKTYTIDFATMASKIEINKRDKNCAICGNS